MAVVAVAAAGCGDAGSAPCEREWTVALVDSDVWTPSNVSSAMGAEGELHLAYLAVEGTEIALRHAMERGDGWEIESVATGSISSEAMLTASLTGDVAIAVAATGAVHVVFFEVDAAGDCFDLRHGAWVGGAWTFETADAATCCNVGAGYGTIRRPVALALDGSGAPHVGFQRCDPDGTVWYATNAGGAWSARQVDDIPAADSVAITVDGAGAAHLAYEIEVGYILIYPFSRWATNASGGWVVGDLDDDGFSGDLATDEDGDAHVIYSVPEGFRHGTWVGDGWALEGLVVDRGGTGPSGASLAFDAAGAAHVGFVLGDSERSDLDWGTLADGEWTVETIAQQSGASMASPTVEAGGEPSGVHVSWVETVARQVWHASAPIELGCGS